MKPAVDLTNLIEMIGDDPDMQKDLFQEFMSSFENGYAMLDKNTKEEDQETWRTQAHAMKGICFNLGAEALGELCKQAQNAKEAPQADKKSLLIAIGEEYARVKDFLTHHMQTA